MEAIKNELIALVKGLEQHLNAIDDDLHALRIKCLELAGEDIPHKVTWHTIQDYAQHKGLKVDKRILHMLEHEAKQISEELGYGVIEIRQVGCSSRFAYHEDVLDEVFSDEDDEELECDDDGDDCEDDVDLDCEDCPCFGCPHCPAEEDD